MALDAQVSPLRPRHPAARWIPAAHRHITLLFLGSVAADIVGGVIASVGEVALRHPPFQLTLDGGGGRAHSDDGGVAWLTVGLGASAASRLARDMRTALAPQGSPERQPHLTVARRASAALIGELEGLDRVPSVTWRVERVTLFRSHLEPAGSRYEVVTEAPLAAV